MNTIHTSAFTFNLPLQHRDLPAFRGALSALAGRDQSLFHNHDNSKETTRAFIQRYPLIQYRVHHGQASILGLNEGARAIEQLLHDQQFGHFRMNGQRLPLALTDYRHDPEFVPGVTKRMHSYRIYSYIPFSQERFREYHLRPSMQEKVQVLERMLRNHIVAFAYGVNWQLPETRRVEVTLTDFGRVRKVQVKGYNAMAFDLEFTSNARLPEGIGLGRKTAFGFGATVPTNSLS